MPGRRSRLVLVAASLLVLTACGNEGGDADGGSPAADTSLGSSAWLVAVTTLGGSDAERQQTTYVSFTPRTGETNLRRLPGVTAGSSDAGLASLLVSADRKWAIPDTTISAAGERSGRLTVYALAEDSSHVLDIRKATGEKELRPIGWAFDPERPDTLRVVDTRYAVWAVSATGGKAVKEDPLPKNGWVFTNKFDPNTGVPFVEGLTSPKTNPPGLEDVTSDPVERPGGTILGTDSKALRALPKHPCELATGFRTTQGTTWLICADDTTLRSFVLAESGDRWEPYGKTSSQVAGEVAGLPLVLPPE